MHAKSRPGLPNKDGGGGRRRLALTPPKPPALCNVRSKNSPVRILKFLGEMNLRYSVFQKKRPAEFGNWLRSEITELGPAFIKLGQALSTRTDLIDKEIIAELVKLQDNNAPADFSEIHQLLCESFGTSDIGEVFAEFEEAPIASASIGQVHIGRLRSGERVVIKVQKPCVAGQIRDDLATLKNFYQMSQRVGELLKAVGLGSAGGSSAARGAEMESILSQYEQFLAAELDYRQEMDHMQRFHEMLEDAPVIVPRVFEELSSENVLVMEYVPSIKITDTRALQAKGYDTTRIAENLVNVFLQMIITHGYVHCDPHPGNLGVSLESEEVLVLYDYGNVIELSPQFRGQLNHLVFSIFQKDVDEFVDLLMALGILVVSNETEVVDIKLFFRSFFTYLESLDFTVLRDSVKAGTQSSDGSVATTLRINPDFLSLFRVFSLMDGTCTKLNPNFNYIDALQPFVENIMMDVNFFDYRARKDLQKLQNYPRLLQNTDQNLVRLDRRVQNLSNNQGQIQNLVIAIVVLQHIGTGDYYGLLPWVPLGLYVLAASRGGGGGGGGRGGGG